MANPRPSQDGLRRYRHRKHAGTPGSKSGGRPKGPFVLRCQRYGEFLSRNPRKIGLRKLKSEAAQFRTTNQAGMAKGAAERVIMRLFDIVPYDEA